MTHSVKAIKQVNGHERRSLASKQRLAKSTMQLTALIVKQVKNGRYATENGPARATRHFAVSKKKEQESSR